MLESQDKILKSNSIIFRLFEISKQSLISKSLTQVIIYLLLSVLKSVIKAIYFILLSLFEYCTSRVNKLARVSSMIITLWLISSWIYIITEKSREIDENGNTVEGDISQTLFLIKSNYNTYSTLCSINILLMFVILVNHFTFSSSLSMFYEVIKRCAFDAIFFILMYLNIIFVLSLVFYILFGITDENYKTLSDSMLNVFLISIGENSSLNIITFNSVLRNFCSAIFMMATILLLNMFVAIIGSHYIEYYLEQGNSDLSSLRMFINAILGDPEKYELNAKQTYIISFRNKLFLFIHKWVNNAIEDDVQEDFGNTQSCRDCVKGMHAAENDVICNAPNRILNMIQEEEINEFLLMEQDSEFKSINTHFWVSFIDKYVSKLVSPNYFMSLSNADNSLEFEKERRVHINQIENFLDDNSEISSFQQDFISDQHVSFCISTFEEKVKLWNKADINLKFEYWRAMQYNYEVLEKEEHKNSVSSLDESCDIRRSSDFRSEEISETNNGEYNLTESQEIVNAHSRPQRHFVTKCQLELWLKHSTVDTQMKLWLDKFKDSNCFLRITLWNSLEFPADYYYKVASERTSKKIESVLSKRIKEMKSWYKEIKTKEFLYMCDNKELDRLAEIILKDKVKSSEDIEMLKFDQTQRTIFKNTNNACILFGDHRTQLWLPLPIEHKLLMIVSEHDKREAELMSLLIFRQYFQQIKTIKKLDNKMENSIKNLLYDRYISFSQQKSTEMSIKKLKQFTRNIEDEAKKSINFIKFLHSKNDQINSKLLKKRKACLEQKYS